LDPREKERDKKGRKNSVFGNLFKKRTKKPSKDEEARELDPVETKSTVVDTSMSRTNTNEDKDSLRKDWTRPFPRGNDHAARPNEVLLEVAKENLGIDKSVEQVGPSVCNVSLTNLGCHNYDA
jgi:hypothetical protein